MKDISAEEFLKTKGMLYSSLGVNKTAVTDLMEEYHQSKLLEIRNKLWELEEDNVKSIKLIDSYILKK